MPVLLKNTYIYIITTTLIFAVYGWWVFGVLGVDYFTGPDALVRIGKTLSTMIIGGYAFEIATVFIISVFSYLVLKKTKDDFTVDERDREILYKSMYFSHLVLCTGLFLSAGALALGWSAFWVLNIIVLAFLLSVIAELATKLFLYRSGS